MYHFWISDDVQIGSNNQKTDPKKKENSKNKKRNKNSDKQEEKRNQISEKKNLKKNPKKNEKNEKNENKNDEKRNFDFFMKHLFWNLNLWMISLVYFLIYFVRVAISTWLNLYYMEKRGFTLIESTNCFFYFEMGGFIGKNKK